MVNYLQAKKFISQKEGISSINELVWFKVCFASLRHFVVRVRESLHLLLPFNNDFCPKSLASFAINMNHCVVLDCINAKPAAFS